jgi:hypothetical protein
MASLDTRVKAGFLGAGVPADLVDELLEAYTETKQRFYRNDLRPTEVEGARFSEAVFRICEWAAFGAYTAISDNLPTTTSLIGRLEKTTSASDSIRMHIPRTLRLIYDIRSKRDVAHLADGIDPNIQDASLVVLNMDWVMAELVRLYHLVSAAEAHKMITTLVRREVPMIQEFNGFPRVLKQLPASEHVLVLLYWRGEEGATLTELESWVRPGMRANLRRTLRQMDEKNLIHRDGDRWKVMFPGERIVVDKKLLQPV